MERLRRGTRRRFAASIACLAFVLHGLVPALAHAMASVARTQFHPGAICSVDPNGARVRLARAIDAEAPIPTQSLPNAAHCPFCALPFGADTLPPSTSSWDAVQRTDASSVLFLSRAEPSPLPARARPQSPRAPPRG